MRKQTLSLSFSVLLFAFSSMIQAQVVLATWDFAGEPGNQVSTPATNVNTDIIASASTITRGSGVNAESGSGSINSRLWNSNARDNNDYYQFSLTAKSASFFQLTNITMYVQRSNTGPTDYQFSYQIGTGTETFLSAGTLSDTSEITLSSTFNITIPANDTVTIKLYAWNASDDNGTFRVTNFNSNTGITVFPIELVSFTGKAGQDHIALQWRTATERDNDYMEVQRSKDGKRFEAIGVVAGHGTSAMPHDYTFVDEQPLPGVNYYRLKQVDFDGKYEYHKIIAVFFKEEIIEPVLVYPTVANDQINIKLSQETETNGEMVITDLAGRVVMRTPLPANTQQQTLEVHSLRPGHYVITIRTERKTSIGRFVKE